MRTNAALALAFTLVASCGSRRGAATDAATDARAPTRPSAVAVQLAPALDGWRIAATLYPGSDPGVGVVLVHQLGSNRSEWSGLIARLQAGRAVTALAIDLRGHGDSTVNPRDERVTWESFGTDRERWAGAALDVVSAVQYLRTAGAQRVVVVGSSVGASAALMAATGALGAYTLPPGAEVDAVAMLSPGVSYRGLDLREPMRVYLATQRPLLMLAGDRDEASVEAVAQLAPRSAERVEAEVFAASQGHGVALCNTAPARWERVDGWVRRALNLAPAQPPRPIPHDV